MFIVIYKGFGKRVKRGRGGKPMVLYGQKLHPNVKTILSDEFVEESGLNNEETFQAVAESLRTDFGICIIKNTGIVAEKEAINE